MKPLWVVMLSLGLSRGWVFAADMEEPAPPPPPAPAPKVAPLLSLEDVYSRLLPLHEGELTQMQKEKVKRDVEAALIGKQVQATGSVWQVWSNGHVQMSCKSTAMIKTESGRVPKWKASVSCQLAEEKAIKLKKGQVITVTGPITRLRGWEFFGETEGTLDFGVDLD